MDFTKERKESDLAARKEAQSIVRAMKNGVNMTDELVVTTRTVQVLREDGKKDPVYAVLATSALEYRAKVREYVDLLLAGKEDLGDTHEEDVEAEDDTAESATPKTDGWGTQGAEESVTSEA